MGRLTAKLTQTATKVAVTRNEYGDTVYGPTSTTNCLYRDISILQQAGQREEVNFDGLLWFDASESVAKGDIYQLDSSEYVRIEKVIRAKDLLRSNTVQFIKCEVTKQRQVS